jgi:uncharacterized protein (DUF488 family)
MADQVVDGCFPVGAPGRTALGEAEVGGDPACWAHLFEGDRRLWTVGHGTLPADRILELLAGVPVVGVVDIRSFPGSRHNPQYGRATMEEWLPAAGVDYRWMPSLGGRRRPSTGSPHVALRHPAFRAYADHMETAEFVGGVADLVDVAGREPTAVMCSESVWWRCHRRLLADYLTLVCGVEVAHLMHDGRVTAHPVTDGARLVDGALRYDRPSETPAPTAGRGSRPGG